MLSFFNQIRVENNISLSLRIKGLRVFMFLVFGLALGFVIKLIEGIPHFGRVGDLFNLLGNICSRIGIWVFIATLIASWSRAPKAGAIHVFSFFCGMLLSYYVYSMKLFGFFPTYYFLRWGLIALASPIAGYIVWFSRGNGWIAAICAALPIGLLLEQGYAFLYTRSIIFGFDLVVAILLLILLPIRKSQILKILPFTIAVAFIIRHYNVLAYLIGGL